MSETYNPRDRSFIKKPEHKVCVTCGQSIAPDVKPMNNHMSRYVNPISEHMIVVNDNADEIVVQGVKMIREEIYLKTKKAQENAPAAKSPVIEALKEAKSLQVK